MKFKSPFLIIGFLSLLSFGLFGQNSPPDPHGLFDYCGGKRFGRPIQDKSVCVQDRWNNAWADCRKLEDPRGDFLGKTMQSGQTQVGQALAPVNCGNGFILTFEDIESSTGQGFDDPSPSPCGFGTVGAARVANVCAVFDYISSVIDLGTVNVEIYFPLSEFDGTGPLATASPLFDTGIPAGTFAGGYVRDHIVNQVDPNPTQYDGVITMDFGNRVSNGTTFTIFPCTTCPGIAEIDMYSIVLHEATHALGFFSFVSPSGASGYSGSTAGPYSLYDQHLFNASATDLISGGASFLGPVADLTSDLLTYEATGNTQPEPVYSPTAWNSGSSISHFDDARSNFEYVMRPATSGEDTRFYTMAEIEVLSNLGYTLQPGVFSSTNSFNNYVIGVDDVGYTTPQGTQICISALNNDFDPDGTFITYGNCGNGCNTIPAQVTLVLGSGTVNIVGNDVCFTPDPWYAGPVIIKYCPTDGEYDPSVVNTDNCTFIEITVDGPCPGDPCNLVCNGNMENRANNCTNTFTFSSMSSCPTPMIANWCRTIGSPDVLVRGCPGNSSPVGFFDIPNSFWAGYSPDPGTEVWDFPNPNNNTYLGMWQIGPSATGSSEGTVIELSQPLDVGKTYILSFQASSKHQYGTSTQARLLAGFTAGPPVPPGVFGQNSTLDWYAQGNSPAVADFPVTTTAKNVAGVWNNYTFSITPTVAGLDHLVIESSALTAGAYTNYIFIDEVSVECDDPPIQIQKVVSNPNPNPGDLITYTLFINNMHPTNAATNLNIQDILPAGVTYVSSNMSNPPNNHFIPNLPAMTSAIPVTITAQVDPFPPLGVPITNCAYVTSGNNCLNINQDNCVDIIVGGVDIDVTKELISGPGPYSPGSNATFQITVTNNGPLDANNVNIQDILPTGLTYVAHSIGGPGTFSYPNLSIGTLANGQTTILRIEVLVGQGACGTLTNCAELTAVDESDLVISNNSDCADIVIGAGGGVPISFPIHPYGTLREQARGVEWTTGGFYVTGYLTDVIDFGFGPMNSNGSIDSYVIKYDNCGLAWQHNEGTPGVENGVAIMENTNTGRVYACGNFSQSFNYQGVNLSGSGAYVVELDPVTGNAIWGRTLQDCGVEDIDVDPITGNVAVTGQVNGGFTFAGTPHTSVGGADIFVAVYDASGSEIWADTYGGAGWDVGMGLVQHTSSRLYLAATLNGIASGPFAGTPATFAGGNFDGVMLVWNPGGIQAGVKYFGTAGDDALNDIDAAPGGDLYIVGDNGGTMNINGTVLTTNGGRDPFIAALDQGMTSTTWAYDWGSTSQYEYGRAVDEQNGRVFMSGQFRGNVNFPGFPNPVLSCVGSQDVFMVSIVGSTGNPINNLQSNVGTSDWIECYDIDNDGAGNGYIPGSFYRTVTLGGTTISSPSGGTDCYVGRGDGNPGGNFYKLGSSLQAGLANLELDVFPNPSTGKVTVRVASGEAESVRISLVDLHGRTQVIEESGVFNAGELQIDLSGRAQGLYFLQMEVNGKVHTEKLMLMHD